MVVNKEEVQVAGGYSTFLHAADLQKKLASVDWFLSLLEKLKEWQKEGYKITDVYIMEGMDINMGILKNFYPLPLSAVVKNGSIKKITRSVLTELVKRLYALRLEQVGIWKTEKEISAKVNKDVEEQNFKSFSLPVYGYGVLRLTFSRSSRGHVLTVRMLDFTVPTLEQANFPQEYLTFLKGLLMPTKVKVPSLDGSWVQVSPYRITRGGIIIHCGATGSGKTTSIASQVELLSRSITGMIITYEEPVEYVFTRPNVLQYEVGIHVQPEEIYDHFLRSTAQVALIGELRTKEQVFRAFDLASRGHLVFSTFHANSVAEGVYALKELLRDNLTLLSSTLLAISYQQLQLVQVGEQQKIVPLYEVLMLPTWYKDSEVKPTVDQIKTKLEDPSVGYQSLVRFLNDTVKTKAVYVKTL